MAKRGIAATAMDEELEEEPQERKRAKIRPDPIPEEEVVGPVADDVPEATVEGLPEDFFDEGSKPTKKGVDEDEWMKFQADIAETIRSHEEKDLDEEEALKRGIVEEFDELETLEDRVERLKKRRAELQKTLKQVQPVSHNNNNTDVEDDDDEIEEEWW